MMDAYEIASGIVLAAAFWFVLRPPLAVIVRIALVIGVYIALNTLVDRWAGLAFVTVVFIVLGFQIRRERRDHG